MVKLLRIITGALLATLTIGAMAGCNRNYDVLGPYALGYDGEHLLVAVCEDRVVEEITMSEYVREFGNSSSTRVWEAAGLLSLSTGESMVVGGANSGLANGKVKPVRLEPGMSYALALNDASSPDLTALFTIPTEGLSEGMWLTPRDELLTQPCPEGT